MNSLPLTLKRIFCDRYNIGMIIFLCLPLLNFFLLSNKVITLFYDGYAYLLIAESLYSGQGIKIGDITHVFYPPGFPFFIAFFKLFIHNSIMAAQFLCAVLSDINILMMFYLCKKYFNSKFIGLLAALIYSLSGRIQLHTITTYAENNLTPLYLLSFLIFLNIIFKGVNFKRILSLSFLFSLSFYVKPDAVIPYFIIVVLLFFCFWNRNITNIDWHQFFLYLSLSFLVFVFLIFPYIYWISSVIGEFRLTGKSNAILVWAKEEKDKRADKVFRFYSKDIQGETYGMYYLRLAKLNKIDYHYDLYFSIKNLIIHFIESQYKYFGILILMMSLFYSIKIRFKFTFIIKLMFLFCILSWICTSLLYCSNRFMIPFLPYFSIIYAIIINDYLYAIINYASIKRNGIWHAFSFLFFMLVSLYPYYWFIHNQNEKPSSIKIIEKFKSENIYKKEFRVASDEISPCYFNGISNSIIIPSSIYISSMDEYYRFLIKNDIDVAIYPDRYNIESIITNYPYLSNDYPYLRKEIIKNNNSITLLVYPIKKDLYYSRQQ